MGTTQLTENVHSGLDRAAGFAPQAESSPEEIASALHRVPVLDGLSPEELLWLATHGKEHRVESGKVVFRSGELVTHLTFLLAGEIHVRRSQSGPVVYFLGRSGLLTGKLPFSRMKTYGGDGFAAGDLWTLDISESHFPAMLQAIPSMAQRCVSVLLDRAREVTRMEQQSEKLHALGKLAANLSHELNNPASAARSAATNLWTELRNYGDQKYRLGALCFSPATEAQYKSWVDDIRALLPSRNSSANDSLSVSAREDTFAAWLRARGIAEPFTLAPVLAETVIETSHLDRLASFLEPHALQISISAFVSALKAERMTDAVIDSTARIFDLITAIKDYSYMDQAPIQEIDVPQALETTLTMLNSRLNGVEILRDFEPETPCISAYGSELNQVWTALIENAVDAMDQLPDSARRELRLRTALSGTTLLVEIWDTGPGISPDIRSRIFEPFFTTKAVGVSLGLGLDAANRIVTKHRGQITTQSKPGETCFQVRLPIEQAGAY